MGIKEDLAPSATARALPQHPGRPDLSEEVTPAGSGIPVPTTSSLGPR